MTLMRSVYLESFLGVFILSSEKAIKLVLTRKWVKKIKLYKQHFDCNISLAGKTVEVCFVLQL